MKCHYELLNIARDAGDDEIKKSYRKLALKYHPDKNPDNAEETIEQFRLIQQAYEVLIDPQERAWYDKHREAILKGGLGHGDKYEHQCLDVYQYFNASCYNGFGNDEKGFYAVYDKVFKTISTEDIEYMDDENFSPPEFGNSESSYEEVVHAFYSYWESYSTSKSYVWVEKYDTREAPNRQVRRLMEQDNKKLRDKAKKERNEEVRALAAFVRKRDKRVQAYKKKLEERAAEIARLAEERKKRDREERLKNMEKYEETEWSAMSALEQDMKQLEASYAQEYGDQEQDTSGSSNSDEDELYYDELYCQACNKPFKTDKAYLNHQKSKKHKENVAYLKSVLEADDAEALGILNDEVNGHDTIEPDADLNDQKKTKLSKKQKKRRKQQQLQQLDCEDDESPDAATNAEIPSTQTTNGIGSNISPDEPVASEEGKLEEDRCTYENNTNCLQEHGAAPDTSPQESSSILDKKSKKKSQQQEKGVPQSCNVCGETYTSRNRLFEHIKVTGHALRVNADGTPVTEVTKAKKNKKKKR